MKRMIASDFHGSAYYCRQLLDLYCREGAEQLVLLGDLVFSGSYDPRYDYDPLAVIDLLNPFAQEILCVEGNCDFGIQELNPQFSITPNYRVEDWEGTAVFLTHGHRFSPLKPPPLGLAQVMLSGHTHVPSFQQMGDLVCLNPGSVSLPRSRSPHSCLLWEDGLLRWLTLEGTEFARKALP